MGKKLTIAHLAPYLPYGLKCKIGASSDKGDYTIVGCALCKDKPIEYLITALEVNYVFSIDDCKPLLRPLSNLKKPMAHPDYYNGDPFTPIYHDFNGEALDMDLDYSIDTGSYTSIYVSVLKGYQIIQTLLEWHFDVFNLIEQGLALPK